MLQRVLMSATLGCGGVAAFQKSAFARVITEWRVKSGEFSPCGLVLVSFRVLLTGNGRVVVASKLPEV